MAEKNTVEKHPYTSSTVAIIQIVQQLRRSFPPQISADTLKKLAIAPNNESYIINLLRFLKVIDADGNRNSSAAKVFAQHTDDDFQPAFAELIQNAYPDLFALHGGEAWELPVERLISYFRGSDHSSEIVGRRQATTFHMLRVLAGKAEAPAPKPTTAKKNGNGAKVTKPAPPKKVAAAKAPAVDAPPQDAPPPPPPPQVQIGNGKSSDFGLTVRIEINLPAGGDKDTYDAIFRSIRENLIDAKEP